ncbi:MAG: SAM-dependent methyltransferase [Umezawaea sp.]
MSVGAAQTAIGPMVVVAVEQYEDSPLVRDELAAAVLPLSARIIIRCARLGFVRRFLVAATEQKIRGMWAGMLCRKRYIDDRLAAAVDVGVEAVVILGAGFDTRGYRLPGTPVFEVDLPANIERKRAAVRRIHADAPDHVTLVPIDFETQDLADVLAEHGYRAGAKTFFVWEGVTQYLTADGVRATMEFLAKASSGSGLVFTYVRQDFLDGLELDGGEAAYREFVVKRRLWHFGLMPDEVAGFLAPHGWHVVEQAGSAEHTDRYVAPSGRALPVSGIERCVHAVRA